MHPACFIKNQNTFEHAVEDGTLAGVYLADNFVLKFFGFGKLVVGLFPPVFGLTDIVAERDAFGPR